MKNLFLATMILLTCHQAAQAQFFSLGIKGGINSQINKQDAIIISNGGESFQLGIDKRHFGTQFGAYIRIGGGLFVQPEVLFNSNKVDYVIGESSASEVIKNEKYQYLDLPLLAGIKLGPLRAMIGPVGHYFLNSRSELTDIQGYEAKFRSMTWGFQTGLNLGLGRISVDARYEGNFSKQGDHITFSGERYRFSHTPSRFILGLNIALIK